MNIGILYVIHMFCFEAINSSQHLNSSNYSLKKSTKCVFNPENGQNENSLEAKNVTKILNFEVICQPVGLKIR